MVRKLTTKRGWRTLVEQYAHLGGLERLSGVFQYCPDLLESDARKPLDEFGDLSTVFEVFKQRRNRDARSSEYPRATHAFRNALDHSAGGPVNHSGSVTTSALRFNLTTANVGVQRQTASGAQRRLLAVRCNDLLGAIALSWPRRRKARPEARR